MTAINAAAIIGPMSRVAPCDAFSMTASNRQCIFFHTVQIRSTGPKSSLIPTANETEQCYDKHDGLGIWKQNAPENPKISCRHVQSGRFIQFFWKRQEKLAVRIKPEKAFVARNAGTVNGKIVFTHFNFVYIPNWGMISVKLGIIIVERRMVNQIFFSLQLNLEKP